MFFVKIQDPFRDRTAHTGKSRGGPSRPSFGNHMDAGPSRISRAPNAVDSRLMVGPGFRAIRSSLHRTAKGNILR